MLKLFYVVFGVCFLCVVYCSLYKQKGKYNAMLKQYGIYSRMSRQNKEHAHAQEKEMHWNIGYRKNFFFYIKA